jgi:hypothetical protein
LALVNPADVVIFVDVDDTLVRTVGTKRIPIVSTLQHVRQLKSDGALLYCWSAGGAAYAKEVATELGILDCFVAFVPKPHVMIDDQEPAAWRTLVIHPNACAGQTVSTYRTTLDPSQ